MSKSRTEPGVVGLVPAGLVPAGLDLTLVGPPALDAADPDAADPDAADPDAVLPSAPAPDDSAQLSAAVVPVDGTPEGPAAPGADEPGVELAEAVDAVVEAASDLLDASPPADEAPEVTSPVNYDDEGLGEVLIEDRIYRFDSGKQGSALCLSAREEGVWQWSYLGELRWDGRDLRSKQLDRRLLIQLSESLRQLASAPG